MGEIKFGVKEDPSGDGPNTTDLMDKITSMPQADLSGQLSKQSGLSLKVTAPPKVKKVPLTGEAAEGMDIMDKIFEEADQKHQLEDEIAAKKEAAQEKVKAKEAAEDAQQKVQAQKETMKVAEESAKKVDDMKQEIAQHEAKIADMEEKAEKDKAAEKTKIDKEEKQKKVADQKAADKEAVRIAEEEEVKNPPPGSKFSADPAMTNTEKIPAGQPCKVLLQESEETPWEFRAFKAPQKCEEGYSCDKVRDIAAISYFKEGSDVSTEISGTVYYCAK